MINIAFGCALWLPADAIDTTRKQSTTRQHSLIHPPFGSGRRITHPGERVVGVMTAHPAWLQSQYDQNQAGSDARKYVSTTPSLNRLRVHGSETTTRLQRTPNRTEKEQENERHHAVHRRSGDPRAAQQ
jgi:hypothetical protein